MKKVLQLQDVSFRRSGREILAGVSWTITAGEHWVLLGANGAGKTTLLKILTGYEWVSGGTVEVLGERFGRCDVGTLRRRIGWVSSVLEADLPRSLRAVEVVLSGLAASLGVYREFTADEQTRARAALEMVGAVGTAGQPFGRLSQGEQQRVLIARALVNEPAILVLDEPCIGLDPAAREMFLVDLDRLVAGRKTSKTAGEKGGAEGEEPTGPTVILVTHHIEEVRSWISHALVLREGKVAAAGPVERVLTGEVLTRAFAPVLPVGPARRGWTEEFTWRCRVKRRGGRYHLVVGGEELVVSDEERATAGDGSGGSG